MHRSVSLRRGHVRIWLCLPLAVAALLIGVGSRPTRASDLSDIVDRASRYVEALGDELAEVVADERYRQTLLTPGSASLERMLESEFVLVGVGDRAEWVGFRDVVTVDGRSVHDRTDRLQQLFLRRDPRRLERARVIADESARYNLGHVHRNFNVPTAALFFLHPANRERFAFDREQTTAGDSETQWVVRYEERTTPTLVRTPRGQSVPARGRFWIEPETGRVVQTQLWLQTETHADGRMVDVNIVVNYAHDSGVELWVPVEMREHYTTAPDERLVTTATYQNYRRFRVDARMLTPREPDRR